MEAAPDQRQALVEEALADLVAEVLNADRSRIDRHRAFGDLGLDSLLSLELRNRLEAIVGEKLSATLLFTYANLSALTAFVVAKLGGSAERPQTAPRAPSVPLAATPLVAPEEIEAMSDEDAERMLSDSLKQLEI
jgi:acyl carrier protein